MTDPIVGTIPRREYFPNQTHSRLVGQGSMRDPCIPSKPPNSSAIHAGILKSVFRFDLAWGRSRTSAFSGSSWKDRVKAMSLDSPDSNSVQH